MLPAAGRSPPATTVPAWFLLPGLGALLASLTAYVQYQRFFPNGGLDLGIYREAVQAFHAGRPVYDLTFALGLPYTYPPVTLWLLTPLASLEAAEALHVLTFLSIAAVFLTVWFATGLMGYRGGPGRIGVAGALTGLAPWLEPVSSNLSLGQVNAFLMLLVVADLATPDRNWLKGAGIGVATACKLVPGLFVVFLAVTGRLRAAAVAAAAFVVMTLAGWVTAPERVRRLLAARPVPRLVAGRGRDGHRLRREPVGARLPAAQLRGHDRRGRDVGAAGSGGHRGRPRPRLARAPPRRGGGRDGDRGVHRAAGLPVVLVAPLGVGRGAAAGAAATSCSARTVGSRPLPPVCSRRGP